MRELCARLIFFPNLHDFPVFARDVDAFGKMREKVGAQPRGFRFQIFVQRFLIARLVPDPVTILAGTRHPRAAEKAGREKVRNMLLAHVSFICFDQIGANRHGYFVNYHMRFRLSFIRFYLYTICQIPNMYKFTSSIYILCVVIGFSAVCFSQNKALVKETNELKTIYKELDKARIDRDIKVFEKYLADDYERIGKRKNFPRAEIIDSEKEAYALFEEIIVSFSKIETAKFSGGKYVLKISNVIKGKAKEDDKVHLFEIFIESTDSWIKGKDGWKLKSQSDRETLIFIDGERLYVD